MQGKPLFLCRSRVLADPNLAMGIFTNGWCSLIYKNGCELPAFAYCIHLTFGAESMAAPLTYGAVQGL